MIDEWGGSLLPSCHNWSIVNGWKNSSSAFFTTRYSFISSETLDAMKKSEKKRERNNSGEMTWKYSYVYVSLSLSLPFPPYFSVFFNKIDKKVDKTSAISTAYFARPIVTSPPSIRYSKERGKRTKGTRYLPNLFANRLDTRANTHIRTKVKFHKGDVKTSKRRRESSSFSRFFENLEGKKHRNSLCKSGREFSRMTSTTVRRLTPES